MFQIDPFNFSSGTGSGSSSSTSHTGLTGEPTLPDWLSTDPDSVSQELLSQYGRGAPGMGQYKRSANENIALTRSTGMQTANSAAADYTNRLTQAGGTAFASGAVKAQAMMPVLKQVAGMKQQKAETILSLKSKNADRQAALAGQLSGARSNYLGMLASTYTTMRGQNISSDSSSRAQDESERMGALARGEVPMGIYGAGGLGGAGSASSADGGAGASGPFNPGYITNAGPIEKSSGWYGANNHNVLLDPSIPGRTSGPAPAIGGGAVARRPQPKANSMTSGWWQ